MQLPVRSLATCTLVAVACGLASAQVTVVEPGHVATKLVDSLAPLDPSQVIIETPGLANQIESIAIDPTTRDLYIQVDTFGSTDIFKVAAGGVVSPVALGTGFGINDRGTDMHFDPASGMLVTQDMNSTPQRIASVNPLNGAIGTYSDVVAPVFDPTTSTFGMGFSKGIGDVPMNDIVFTSDLSAGGIHSVTSGGVAQTTHVPPPLTIGGADDMVIQPDGDWIWVGDFANGIYNYSPVPPHPGVPSGLDLQTMFNNAGLVYNCGSRAASCDGSGDLYVSYSCAPGGNGIFRVDEALTTSTLVATIGNVTTPDGLQDLVVGPASNGMGTSLYITVHTIAGAEQVWEITTPECPEPECFLVLGSVPGQDVFEGATHTWLTQVANLRDDHAILLDSLPVFPVPVDGLDVSLPGATARTRLPMSGPEPVTRFYAQVVMWNPGVFPGNPEQWSNGLEVTIWPNGLVTGLPYGTHNGMEVRVEMLTGDDGRRYFRFPFTIEGI